MFKAVFYKEEPDVVAVCVQCFHFADLEEGQVHLKTFQERSHVSKSGGPGRSRHLYARESGPQL
jgi:hypothetical protein